MNKLLMPQKPPTQQGLVVYPWLRERLVDLFGESNLVDLVDERYQQGIEKYGQPLMTEDGRDTESDLAQEIADSLFYCAKGIIQGKEWDTLLQLLSTSAIVFLSTVDNQGE